jgi:hypothetical protein
MVTNLQQKIEKDNNKQKKERLRNENHPLGLL